MMSERSPKRLANHRARHDLVKPATASGNRTERFELSKLREGGSNC
jgi:hypothetical protein